ncbi:PREDICTED: beta-fructofuranosidase, insoluble isoenzyme 1 [Nelumbo nucifera]|uniref:Beta-fructofuranosidase, insoluble isoenzyme 1-like n=2 Tax=Nelumbo nucifera TaxID=4432 RepID=A0A822ZYQ0_NELNU|nr:PREDICTED: beta-fructofuranosidase, insoluble isoenzyme 1 [Nelumbo nucifera]DAD48495.1 TPA_asm: hypothetical protein HUJ06_018432 [Nelumbo nucifera]
MATCSVLSSVLIFFYSNLLIWNNGVFVEASHRVFPQYQPLAVSKVSQRYRTGYHFQPSKHWINDPNGPMYYNGIYHLFYQYNPRGAVWGNIVWAHSVSTDLINWAPLEPALYPTEPFDINGCWSGSATILPGNKPVILYTGIDTQNRQVQNIAVPKNLSDPYLREWTKPGHNPLMVPAGDINVSSFRDPTTAWWGNGHWKVLVGNKRGRRGMALLYRSRDFVTWKKSPHPLHSAPGTGMWECPDFFPVSLAGEEGLDASRTGVGVKHVLKVSLDSSRFEYYTVGRYFPEKDRYIPDNTSADNAMGLRFDYGNFYASKTFFDAGKKRRILWGWTNESDTAADDVAKGWAGIQTIPRKLWLDKSGRQIVQWPIQELEALRQNGVHLRKVHLRKGGIVEVKGITAAQADVEVTFSLPNLKKAEPFDPSWDDPQQQCSRRGATVEGGVGPFGLLALASRNLDEYTSIFFRVFKAQDKHVVLMCSDQTRSSLRTEVYKPAFGGFVYVDLEDGKLSLRSLIDNSVVESFGAGGKTCITSRVYPILAVAEGAHLYAFNNGSEPVQLVKLKAWSMRRPRMN